MKSLGSLKFHLREVGCLNKVLGRDSLKCRCVLTSSYLADQPSKCICILWFCKSWSMILAMHQLLTESFASIKISSKSRVFRVFIACWLISCYSAPSWCLPASPRVSAPPAIIILPSIWRSLFMMLPAGGALPVMPWPAGPDDPPCCDKEPAPIGIALFRAWWPGPRGPIGVEPLFRVSGLGLFMTAPSPWLKILYCCWFFN